MDVKTRIAIALVGLLWLYVVLKLVKRRRIWERHAILWVFLGVSVVFLPAVVNFFDRLLIDLRIVEDPPNFFFLLGFVGVLFILLQCTVEITTLMRQNREAIQDLAILDEKVRQLEARVRDAESSEPAHPGVP
jgi:hypothetical protein